MLVFRFEHEDGEGAYRNISYGDHTADTGHPGPANDLPDWLISEIKAADPRFSTYCPMYYIRMSFGYDEDDDENVIFGFESMKQAYAWFSKSEVVNMQLPKGVHLFAYTVPEASVVKLKRQVVFDKQAATRI